MKLLIVNELSKTSSDLWTDIDSRMREIFMMTPEIGFAGLSVKALADSLQLPPVRGKLIFTQFFITDSMKHHLGFQLWHLFKYSARFDLTFQK